ncbi:hypothetical protein [Streptomyces sp. NPDC051776]|uniref:hypothetical protein n=1 Tax=Streptomyces sp. NPDC051776 TaxID=3155414 RepID=UPI00341D1F49
MTAPVESRRQSAVQYRGAVPGGGTPGAASRSGTPGGAAQTHGREIRAVLDDLDEQIIAMVLRRAELARRYQSVRRVSGLPATELAWENRMLCRFADRLGTKGADIARAVLSLSQLATARGGRGPGVPGPGSPGNGVRGPGGSGSGSPGSSCRGPGDPRPGSAGSGGPGPGSSGSGSPGPGSPGPGSSGSVGRRASPRNGDGGRPAE